MRQARLFFGGKTALLAAFLVLLGGPVLARPTAIVIGNDNYTNLPRAEQLQRAEDDARAVARRLEAQGFQVVLRLNASRDDIVSAVKEAGEKIEPGSTALLFYAGHGVEIAGANYLIPSDAPAPAQGDAATLTSRSVALSFIQSSLGGHGARATIIILDACRANPYEVKVRGPGGGDRGLARISAPAEGYFMIYSAGFGQTALDRLPQGDTDANSVFTRILLRYLPRTELSLVAIAKGLQRDVSALAAQADHPQTPAYYDQLNGDFTLLGQAVDAGAAPAPPAADTPPAAPQHQDRPAAMSDPSALRLAATGAQGRRLLEAIGPVDGVQFTDAAHADLTIDTDTGRLSNAQGQTLFNFGRSQSPPLYLGVLAKWLLAKSVSGQGNLGVDTEVRPLHARYKEGDKASVAVTADAPGYVIAFDMGADGSISLLEPDPARPASRMARTDADGRYQIPIELAPPAGTDHIFVAVTPSEASDFAALLRRLNGRAPNRAELRQLQTLFDKYSRMISMVEFYTDNRGLR